MIPFLKNKIQTYTASGLILLAVCVFAASCQSNKPEEIAAITNREEIPSLIYDEFESTLTDSGKITHKFITPKLLRYDRKKEPYMEFPNGLHVIMYQSNGEIDAQIKCRNAFNYEKKGLWELNIDVEAINLKGEVLNTEQLYWDTKAKRIYSEKFVTITQGSSVYTGTGFEADENMENWDIKNIQGDLEFEE
ncbi:LPS export ABC transporter periplasmic protein LptC [Carboxylicivirga sp. M1479]|uniref:LPS export ABC transporter periplasmic protein LptC n=1 Tax=Carboxylicivirga sp. M1479 TaxID=2594476 RepID=UPI001178473B|nr:LPS export ABC transporter periplasmic protein LptC [Carboxylicivirga sp. M1479]TRX66183.1 LPS export ABC transporter periplasmic protein LptC [Carboxylicivirga sp. M1479]